MLSYLEELGRAYLVRCLLVVRLQDPLFENVEREERVPAALGWRPEVSLEVVARVVRSTEGLVAARQWAWVCTFLRMHTHMPFEVLTSFEATITGITWFLLIRAPVRLGVLRLVRDDHIVLDLEGLSFAAHDCAVDLMLVPRFALVL